MLRWGMLRVRPALEVGSGWRAEGSGALLRGEEMRRVILSSKTVYIYIYIDDRFGRSA